MHEELGRGYQEELAEILSRVNEIRQEISRDFKDSPTIKESAEERFSEAEKKIFSSMKNYILEDREKAEKYILEARNKLEEALLQAWKQKATYVQEITNGSIDGFVKRTADLDLFHRLDIFNEIISSAEEMERDEAIENYKKALSMKENLWRDIDLIKKKSSFEYFYKIALPMVIASMTAGITIYYFTRQMNLVVLTIISSLLVSIGLFSFIRGRVGKESIALLACVFVIIWVGASILGVDLRSVLFSSSMAVLLSTVGSLISALLSFLRGARKLAED